MATARSVSLATLSSICNTDDQISIEPSVGITMAWTLTEAGRGVVDNSRKLKIGN
jgi:hypothetical protein